MKEVMKELDNAYKLLAAIPVSGDYVDVMAEARVKLRAVYHWMVEQEEEQHGG